jgi:hypothetical protein
MVGMEDDLHVSTAASLFMSLGESEAVATTRVPGGVLTVVPSVRSRLIVWAPFFVAGKGMAAAEATG